jgi:hypothetical protein
MNISSARGTSHCRKIRIPCGDQLVICGLYVVRQLATDFQPRHFRAQECTRSSYKELLLLQFLYFIKTVSRIIKLRQTDIHGEAKS